jgi:hypothetical protein
MKKLMILVGVLVLIAALTTSLASAAPAARPAQQDNACARFNFLQGRDQATGSRSAGRYEMRETLGGLVATWEAKAGDKDSGEITGIAIARPSVHVTVTFFPADGSAPIQMEIVNPAAGTSFGWLARDMCHSVEIQYPMTTVTPTPTPTPVAPTTLPVTGFATPTVTGPMVGFVLLAMAFMLIAAGLWPIKDNER